MQWLQTTITIFKKDLQTEFRTRFGFNMVLAFVVSALLLVMFTLKAQELNPTPKSGLVWIIVLFAALSSLGRSFISETEKNTYDVLRIHAKGSSVFAGKLFFNILFSLVVNLLTFLIYIFLADLTIVSWAAFGVILIFGTLGLSGVSTLIAAIVSQADRKGAIFSVLTIPLFIPFILLLTSITKSAFVNGLEDGFTNDFSALIGFIGVTISAGIVLFEYIWEE
ncbi:heme exporter protein CcmB [Balneola vulgaris]|jgi:heme exporter protein B|uniref:heme exporter protein CcmB n=1 Tax=Balneola vulgaris TaxID=287535 RepID=UPI0012FCAD48|nr:heme exporter protein CcmB [Balneola vulgaris]